MNLTKEQIFMLPPPKGFLLGDLLDNLLLDNREEIVTGSVLEPFCGHGEWHTKYLLNRFRHVIALDIDADLIAQFELNFKDKYSNYTTYVGDAPSYIHGVIGHEIYECVVLDTPAGKWNSNQAEHFGIFNEATKLLADDSILIFNTVSEPYNYDKSECAQWKNMRSAYYNSNGTQYLSRSWLHEFYTNKLELLGFEVTKSLYLNKLSKEMGDHMGLQYQGFRLRRYGSK